MATWSTDFSTIPSGDEIIDHGWEDASGDGWAKPAQNQPVAVVNASAPVSDRWVEVTSNLTTSHLPGGWKPPTVPSPATARMQVCAVVARSEASSTLNGVIGRGDRSGVDEVGVVGCFRNNDTDIRYMDYTSGEPPDYSDGVAHGVADPDDWAVLVMDLNGSTISMKAWAYGDTEPVSWQLVETTVVTGTGWPGIGARLSTTGRTARWGYFSWGSDGDAAPRPGATPPASTTGTVAVTEAADSLSAAGTAAALDTPSNAQVTVTSRTSATVTWDDVPAADTFQVEARVRAGQS